MPRSSNEGRTDCGFRVIMAPPGAVFRAYLDPVAVATWRPPAGMTIRIDAFEPREGGSFRMALAYIGADHTVPGKTSEHVDVVRGRFLELLPDQRITERVEFETDDPAFTGAMTVITTLTSVPGGTEVSIRCQGVPEGIRPGDHQAGIASTLENLAAFLERGDASHA